MARQDVRAKHRYSRKSRYQNGDLIAQRVLDLALNGASKSDNMALRAMYSLFLGDEKAGDSLLRELAYADPGYSFPERRERHHEGNPLRIEMLDLTREALDAVAERFEEVKQANHN